MMLDNDPSAEATLLASNTTPIDSTSDRGLPKPQRSGQKGKSAPTAGGTPQRSYAMKPNSGATSKQDRVVTMLRRKTRKRSR